MSINDMAPGELLFKALHPYAPTVQLQKQGRELNKLKKFARSAGTKGSGRAAGGTDPSGDGGGVSPTAMPVVEVDAGWVSTVPEFTADGAYSPRLRVAVPEDYSSVRGFIRYRMAVTRSADTEGATITTLEGTAYPQPGYAVLTLPLAPQAVGEKVAVQLQAVSSIYGDGAWSAPVEYVVPPDTTPPGAVENLSLTAKAGTLEVTYEVPTDADYATTEVRMGLGTDPASFDTFTKAGASANGYVAIPWDYRSMRVSTFDTIIARHLDRSGNQGEWAVAGLDSLTIDATKLGASNLDLQATENEPLIIGRDDGGTETYFAYYYENTSIANAVAYLATLASLHLQNGVNSIHLGYNDKIVLDSPNGISLQSGTGIETEGDIALDATRDTATIVKHDAGTAYNELVLKMEGDQYGATSLKMHNRTGENGAILELVPDDVAIKLLDFIFKHPGGQRNIRLEGRAAETKGGVAQEWQLGTPGTPHTTMSDAGLVQSGYIKGPIYYVTGGPGTQPPVVMLYQNTSTGTSRGAGYLVGTWNDSTDATRKGLVSLVAQDYAAERTGLTVGADGSASTVGFYGTAPVAKPTVTGAKGGNAALTSLLSALANLGLITNSTT